MVGADPEAVIRRIATAADVDPALVHHYFGSKEDLFAASVQMPMGPAQLAEHIIGDGLDEAGERLARLFLTVWEEQPTRDALLALVRGAMTNAAGAAALREFFDSALLSRVADRLGGDDATLRVSLAASQMIGVVMLRHVIGMPALAQASVDDLVAQLAPRLQTYFTPDTHS